MTTETLNAAGESSVVIHHHGAHITSWTNSKGRSLIYTSPTAIYNGQKAIRGGVPICFPQFGKNGPLSQHGFARNMPWALHSISDDKTTAVFTLQSTEYTISSDWPYAFHVAYTVTLSTDGDSLTIQMDVTNKEDSRPFSFTTALHSYFACDARNTIVPDLDQVQYSDSLEKDETKIKKIQIGDIHFPAEVDRVYLDTQGVITIPSTGLTIKKDNLPEAVVWNPYIEKAAGMGDLPDDAWKHFICIEPARIIEPAVVQPGQVWTCKVELSSN